MIIVMGAKSFTVYLAGEYCAMDIHVWERPCFSGRTLSLHARDLGSEMSWVFLLKHASDIDDHVGRTALCGLNGRVSSVAILYSHRQS